MSDKTKLQSEASATQGLSSTEGAVLERLVMFYRARGFKMDELKGVFIFVCVCFVAALVIEFFVYRAMDKILDKNK